MSHRDECKACGDEKRGGLLLQLCDGRVRTRPMVTKDVGALEAAIEWRRFTRDFRNPSIDDRRKAHRLFEAWITELDKRIGSRDNKRGTHNWGEPDPVWKR